MKQYRVSILILSLLFLSGCALFRNQSAVIYPMSYDQTYSTALAALNDMKSIGQDKLDDWRLVEADFSHGVIVLEAGGYWVHEKEVKFIVKNLGPYRTEIRLYRKRATPFTEKFFKAIDRRVAEQALTHPS